MKTKILFLLGALTLSLSAHASNVGFSAGNDFLATYIEGEIGIQCSDPSGQSDFAYFRCSEEILDPAEYSYFVGPAGTGADQVVLKATREDGSTREKTESYDDNTGRSKDSFNLWISTLLQRPLLKYGKNEIQYTLNKDGAAVANGSFTATVNKGQDRQCRYRRTYFSNNINDCRTGGFYCDYYFRDENYCQ